MQSSLQKFCEINVTYDNLKYYDQIPMCNKQKFECFDRLANMKDIAVLSDRIYGQLKLRTLYSKRGKPEFVALEEKLKSGYFSNFIKRIGCMLHNRLDSIQDRLFHAGLPTRWLEEVTNAAAKYYNKNLNTAAVISFKISHLQGPVFLLIIGLLIGFIVFCLEVLFNFILTTKARKS